LEADGIYDRIISEGGDTEDNRAWANHEAGYMYHQNDYEDLAPYLADTYAEIGDNYNKSSLAVLYALFETETSRLCTLMQASYNRLIDHESLSGSDYILKYLKYLKLVIEMDVSTIEQFVNAHMKSLKLLRNKIMHHDSEFPGETTELLKIIEDSNGMVSPTHGPGTFQVSINDIQYVLNHANLVRQFFQQLFWAVEGKNEYPILLGRIQYLFSAFDPNIVVNNVSYSVIPHGYRLIADLESATVPSMNCKAKFSIISADQDSVTLLNQLDEFPLMTEFNDFLHRNPEYIFKELLQGANLTGAHHYVSIMVYL
jgi:hypothetical protein